MKKFVRDGAKKIFDLSKEFFYPSDLMSDADSFTREQLEALSDRSSISKLLFYRSYIEDEETEMGYYIQADGRVGIVFRLYPPPYLTSSTEKDIISLLSSVVMDDTIINFTAYASKNTNQILDEFRNLRTDAKINVRNPEVLKEYTDDLAGKFQSWTNSSMAGKQSDLRLRNFVHVMSVLFPYDTSDFVINQQYNQIMGMFKSYGIRVFKPDELIPLVQEIINPSRKEYPLSNDTITTLNKQMTKDTFIKLNEETNLLEMPDNWKARVLTTDKYPREIDIYSFQNIFFNSLGNDFQINLPNPFLLSLTIKFTNIDKSRKNILSKAKWNLGQLSGMPSMVYKKQPHLKERRDENEEVIQYITNLGEVPLDAFFTLVLFEQKLDKLDQYTALIKKSFSQVPGQWVLKEEKFTQIAYQTFLMSLPLQYSDIIHSNIDKFDKNFRSNNAQMTPLIGGFAGNGTPNHIYVDRTGQLVPLNIYNSDNYNIVVIGPMGSGKSVWTNDFLAKAVSAGWYVRMIDFGRSYEKFSESIGGQFVDFSENVCMNFFTEIGTKIEIIDGNEVEVVEDEEIELLTPIVGFMASLNLQDIYKDETASSDSKVNMTVLSVLISNAIRKAFALKGRDAGMREVREVLIDYKDKAINDNERVISDRLIPIIQTLEPYAVDGGPYFKLFNGASNVSFDNNYFILELNDIATSPVMPVVAMLFLQKTAREAFVGYMKDKSQRRIVGVDEAWKVLSNPLFAKFLEDFARRIRKYYGIPMIITQTVDEFFQNPQAEVIYKTADWKIYLPHSENAIDQALSTGKMSLSDFDIKLFKSLKARYPYYSEFFVKQKRFEFVALLKLSAYGYWLATSAPKDRLQTDIVMKKYNLTLQDAIRFQAKEMEGLSEDEIFQYLSNRNSKNKDMDWDKFFKKMLQLKSILIRKEPIVNVVDGSIAFYENLPSLLDGKIEYFPKDFIFKAKELNYLSKIKTIFLREVIKESKKQGVSSSINISLDGMINKKFTNLLFNILNEHKNDFFLEIKLDYDQDDMKKVISFTREFIESTTNAKIIFDNMKFDNIHLASLIEFQPEYIKMNLNELKENKDKPEFFSMIRVLEEQFNIKTIVTFIENEEDLEFVKKHSIHYVQGFYVRDKVLSKSLQITNLAGVTN